MTPRRDPAAGFTMLEVVVALTIGGLALAGAAALLTGMGGRAAAVDDAAQRTDYDANRERLLRALVANIALSPDTARSLVGDGQGVTFNSWCEAARGWLEPCAVRLSFEPAGNLLALHLQLTSGTTGEGAANATRRLTLSQEVRSGCLRYLAEATHGGTWMESWSRIVVPAAIAVIVERDTLLLPVWGGV